MLRQRFIDMNQRKEMIQRVDINNLLLIFN